MRIPSGVTDQYIYFIALDSTDLKTRETGLTTFTVYRSRNGGAAAAMTTPTINEVDATNMPGVYELLLDEDMTIGSGNDSEEMVFHITQASMAPVTRTIELYRPKITAGNTLDVTATGAAGIDWGNIENASTTVDLSATDINLVDTTTTNTDMRGTDSAYTGTPPTAAAIADAVWDELQSAHVTAGSFGEIATEIASILADTNELQTDDVPGLIAALNNIAALDVWHVATASIVTASTIGLQLKTNIDAVLSDIETDTAEIGAAGAGLTDLATAAALAIVDSNVDAILVDTGTTLDTNITAIKAVTDALTAASAANLALSAGQIIAATVDTVTNGHTPTTTEFQADDVTEATADHYNGRIVIFTSGALAGQATDITGYAAVGGVGQFTVTAMTEAPANNDTFIIV